MGKDALFIVLGSTGGIGSALYKKIMTEQEDARFILLQRHASEYLDENTKVVLCDFENRISISEVQTVVQQEINNVSKVFLIIASGTITPLDKIGLFDAADIYRSVNINVNAPVVLLNMLACVLKGTDKDVRVINLDSGAAYQAIDGWGLYCSAKAYLSMFLKVLDKETAFKIVNLDPGVVDSGMQESIRKTTEEQCSSREIFVEYKKNGTLRSPEMVAGQIYERYIERWIRKEICERL